MTAPYADLFTAGCERVLGERRCRRTPSYHFAVGRRCSTCTPARLAGLPEPAPLYVQPAPRPPREQLDVVTALRVLRALRRALFMPAVVAETASVARVGQRGPLPSARPCDPCGCPTSPARAVVDQVAHARFHRLVVEQGGPAGAVDAASVRLARGGHAGRLRSAS